MGAEAAALAAQIANAIKASGVVVRVTPEDFQRIIAKTDKPLVIWTTGGFLSRNYQYLTSYKGFAFFTKTGMPLELSRVETIAADKIWIPG
ncbi:MAG TPA: hypothetical protein VIG25_07895 [Pyrinomonadaceae bacterium]|jgi:hypothetical protein